MPRALTTDFMCFLGTFAHAIPFACSVFAFCFYQLWNICQFLGYISDVASCIKTFWSRAGSHSLHLLGQSGSERGSLLRNPQSLSYALRRPHRALHCGYSWTCPIKGCVLFSWEATECRSGPRPSVLTGTVLRDACVPTRLPHASCTV